MKGRPPGGDGASGGGDGSLRAAAGERVGLERTGLRPQPKALGSEPSLEAVQAA